MADLSITAANVVAGANAVIERGIAGGVISAGQVVYLNPTTQKYSLADNNSATAEARLPRGIALNGAANNQPMAIIREGEITIGATMVAGVAYYLSDTPGGICPVADLGSGEYVALIGLAKSTSVLAIDIQIAGVAL